MPSHARSHADSRAHDAAELVERESSQDRYDPVVPAYWVKSQRPRGKPDAGGGEPAAANVTDDDAAARHAVELAQQYYPIVAAKVVQQLRAEHNVERAISDRQVPRIGAHHRQDGVASGDGE